MRPVRTHTSKTGVRSISVLMPASANEDMGSEIICQSGVMYKGTSKGRVHEALTALTKNIYMFHQNN